MLSYDFLAHSPPSTSSHTGLSVPRGPELLLVLGILYFQFSLSGSLFPCSSSAISQPKCQLCRYPRFLSNIALPYLLTVYQLPCYIFLVIFYDLKWSYLLIWLLSVPQHSLTEPRGLCSVRLCCFPTLFPFVSPATKQCPACGYSTHYFLE